MLGTIIGKNYKAVRADLRNFSSKPKLEYNTHFTQCRYVLCTDTIGRIWAPQMQEGMVSHPTKMLKSFKILNVICADLTTHTLVKVQDGWFPIEVNPGDELAIQFAVEQYVHPTARDQRPLPVPAGYGTRAPSQADIQKRFFSSRPVSAD